MDTKSSLQSTWQKSSLQYNFNKTPWTKNYAGILHYDTIERVRIKSYGYHRMPLNHSPWDMVEIFLKLCSNFKVGESE